jgi:RNA 3'-terminal phosphate cyclase (ATP)
VEIRGSLFQDFPPSVFHLRYVIMPMLAQIGLAAEIEMIWPSYAAAGQGIIGLAVPPALALRPLVPRRGRVPARVWGISLASHLDDYHVTARMAAAARMILDAAGVSAQIRECSESTAAQAASS